MDLDPREITGLLNRATSGDEGAARQAFDAIYAELRRIASSKASRLPAGAALQTTALVHEAYMRIVDRNPDGWQNMRHFYFTAARAMRDILVEDARRKGSQKRGAGPSYATCGATRRRASTYRLKRRPRCAAPWSTWTWRRSWSA